MDLGMDQILHAIAVSSGVAVGGDQRQAFAVLQRLQENRSQQQQQQVQLALQWLQTPVIVYNNTYDVTTPTKLLALQLIQTFLETPGLYVNLSQTDREALRHSLLQAAHVVVVWNEQEQQKTDSQTGNSSTSMPATSSNARILVKKIAAILEELVIRDFPQRWTTFATDVLSPMVFTADKSSAGGGLWYAPLNDTNNTNTQHPIHLGVTICLECLKRIAEDCTESEFNAKVSTKRRNDVLIGLNEIAFDHLLPRLHQLLADAYPILQQTDQTLMQMHQYLIQNQQTVSQLAVTSPTDYAAYQVQIRRRKEMKTILRDTLLTLEKFCAAMPIRWMVNDQTDFVAVFLHLLSEPSCQVIAAECIETLAGRKLDEEPWMRMIRQLPEALRQSHAQWESNHLVKHVAEQGATRTGADKEVDSLTLQLEFYRTVSRMLANVVATNIAHISANKRLDQASMRSYLTLMTELLQHPSGRVASEQLHMWIALVKEPQISSKTTLLNDLLQPIVLRYMDHFVRVRFDEVEEQTHPMHRLLSASFDDEDDYDAWMSDLRSRSSLLFKMFGNLEPHVAASLLNTKIQGLLASHGTGQPINFVDPSNQQLTPKSDAVLQFEGILHPFYNSLEGIPSWALDDSKKPETAFKAEVRAMTRAAFSELAKNLISWDPNYVWLKFRRAALLEPLKVYWQYEPSTMLPAVDSLLRYLGLNDEWNVNTASNGSTKMSGEVIGLKKKSGVTLVAIAKVVPHHLVPWISQLTEATKTLLASPGLDGQGLIPMNQMHLFEFLSCLATAVEDPTSRSNFISDVLSNAVEILESAEVRQTIQSSQTMFAAYGVSQATVENVVDPSNVQTVKNRYNKIFTAVNRLLAVGRRCNEAARKQRLADIRGPPVTAASETKIKDISAWSQQIEFNEEGPISLQQLAIYDPFAPLWPRILPPLLQICDSVLGMWRPENQAQFLGNPIQRYAFAISDDEAFLAKTQDGKTGGVFGEGGTAGSVVSGTDRRDMNLVPQWSSWFNELRGTCFQLLGLLAGDRALFAPEVSSIFPRIVEVIANPVNLQSMEHRHLSQFLKHVVELLLVSCPSTLYPTHLAPFIGPIFEHVRFRLEKTWYPVIGGDSSPQLAAATKALNSAESSRAAMLAAQGGDAWFTWYYSHAGLFVGDLDDVTAEAAVEKYRVEIGRAFSDVLQVALALKGDWALVLANLAKEEQSKKRTAGPVSSFNNDGVVLNADGTPKTEGQAIIDAQKLLRINGLCHFVLLENEQIAGNLTLIIIQCLGYPDAYTCRRIAKICHRALETVAWTPQYSQLLGQRMFTQAVKNIVTEPKWMVGMEWDMINVLRDLYCRLVLGQTLQPGGQGLALQQSTSAQNPNEFEQAKTVDRPLQGGGILTTPSNFPRQVLASLPGITPAAVEELEQSLKSKRSAKDQKDVIRDLLRQAADNLKEANPSGIKEGAAGSIFDRAIEEESLLHSKDRPAAIPDLPEKLVTQSQVEKQNRMNEPQPEGLGAANLF